MRKAPEHRTAALLTDSKAPVVKMVWLDNQDLLLRYHLSGATLRRWRAKKIVPYYKIGTKIYYIESEVTEAIRKYRNPEDSQARTE